MSPNQLLITSALLGLFVLLAGAYGLLYALGHLRGKSTIVRWAYGCYVAQWVVTLAIVWYAPLTLWWKVFVVASCMAYWIIPPATWHLLQLSHETLPEEKIS